MKKLSEQKVQLIKNMRNKGYSYYAISKALGIATSTVIRYGKMNDNPEEVRVEKETEKEVKNTKETLLKYAKDGISFVIKDNNTLRIQPTKYNWITVKKESIPTLLEGLQKMQVLLKNLNNK